MLRQKDRCRGQAQVEFILGFIMFIFTVFGSFELCRAILVYNTLANSSRVGVRYATTHGSTNLAGYVNSTGSTSEIETVVKDFTRGSLIDRSQLTVTVTYPDGGATANAPGSRIRVVVSYPYTPIVALPFGPTLSSVTEGVITF